MHMCVRSIWTRPDAQSRVHTRAHAFTHTHTHTHTHSRIHAHAHAHAHAQKQLRNRDALSFLDGFGDLFSPANKNDPTVCSRGTRAVCAPLPLSRAHTHSRGALAQGKNETAPQERVRACARARSFASAINCLSSILKLRALTLDMRSLSPARAYSAWALLTRRNTHLRLHLRKRTGQPSTLRHTHRRHTYLRPWPAGHFHQSKLVNILCQSTGQGSLTPIAKYTHFLKVFPSAHMANAISLVITAARRGIQVALSLHTREGAHLNLVLLKKHYVFWPRCS